MAAVCQKKNFFFDAPPLFCEFYFYLCIVMLWIVSRYRQFINLLRTTLPMKTRIFSTVIAALMLSVQFSVAQSATVPDSPTEQKSGVVVSEYRNILPRHYMQVTIGDPVLNWLFTDFGKCDCYYDCNSEDRWFLPDVYEAAYSRLPSFAISYYYALKPWLLLGGEISYFGSYSFVNDRVTNKRMGVAGVTSLGIIPSIRFQYLNRRHVGLYSGLSLGVFIGISHGNSLYNPMVGDCDAYTLPAFQLTALGVRVGNKVYGLAEFGVGNKGMVAVGVGARL